MQHPRNAVKDAAGADVDDLAVALRRHLRGDVLHHQERPAQIDRHDAVPQCHVDLGTLGFLQRREQCGVVDQHVDLAKALHGLRDQRLDGAFVADVGDRARHRIGAVVAGDLVRHVLAVGEVGDHQPRALGGKRLRIVPADALGAAGDNGDAAIQSRHELILPLVPPMIRASGSGAELDFTYRLALLDEFRECCELLADESRRFADR